MIGTSVIRALVEAGAIVCADCDDSGWVRFECTGGADCGRRRRHLPHTYATPCPCRAVNPAYQDKVQRSGRRSAA
jgi:hypothetical protein